MRTRIFSPYAKYRDARSLVKKHLISLLRQSFMTLPHSWRRDFFVWLTEQYNVRSAVVDGDNGIFDGQFSDCLFMNYAETKNWSRKIISIISRQTNSTHAGTFLDIGANIGLITIPLARNSSWSFHAFEPDPINCARLRSNLLRNFVDDRVIVHNVALSNISGTLKLRRSPTNCGDYRIELDRQVNKNYDEPTWSVVEVESRQLDHIILAPNSAVQTIIKIDTQGAEPLIVDGGHNTFSKARLVVMEFWPYGIIRLGLDPLGFLGTLKNMYPEVLALNQNSSIVAADSFAAIYEITKQIVDQSPYDQRSQHFDLVLSRSKIDC